MPTSLPIPRAHWPKDADDLETLDQRMGGVTRMVLAEATVRPTFHADGEITAKVKHKIVGFDLEYAAEFQPTDPQPAPAPEEQGVREFLQHLARIAAKAWADELRQSTRGCR